MFGDDELPSYTQLHGEQSSSRYPDEKSQNVNSDSVHRAERRETGGGAHRFSVSSGSSAISDGGKLDKHDKRENAKNEFERAHADEMKHAVTVDALDEKVKRLREQVRTPPSSGYPLKPC
jgi:hypothetical protein